MTGTFKEGVKLVPKLLEGLEEHALFIDQYRIMVFNYKLPAFILVTAIMTVVLITPKDH